MTEATIFLVPAAKAPALLGAERGATTLSMGLLSAADGAALAARLSKEPDVILRVQPAIVTRSGDGATIFVGESYREDLHRPAGIAAYEAALGDAYWSGDEVGVRATVPPGGDDLAADLFFIHRAAPPENVRPDPAALLGGQLHGRMGIVRMESGSCAAICLAPGKPSAPGDRVVLLATLRALPADAASRAAK